MSNIPTTVTIAGRARAAKTLPRFIEAGNEGSRPSQKSIWIAALEILPVCPALILLSALDHFRVGTARLNLTGQFRGGAGHLGELALGDSALNFGPLRRILYHERDSRPGSVQGSLHFADALARPDSYEGLC